MSNPLMSMLSGGVGGARIDPQAIAAAKRMMGMLGSVKNPGAALQQAAGQNPSLAAVMRLCNGRDPKAVFFELCDQRGINPDDILSQLR